MILGVIGHAGKWGGNYLKAAVDCGVLALTIGRNDEASQVDAVAIAVHPRDAVGIASEFLSEGVPVIIEKPAGLSTQDAHKLAIAEDDSDGFVLVAHQHLFAEGMEEMRRRMILETDQVQCRAIFGGHGPVRDYSALWDYGPHAVAASLALSGRWIKDGASRTADGFLIRGPRGFTNCIASNTLETKTASVTMLGVKAGELRYDGYAPAEPALTRMVRAFAKAVANGGTDDYRFGARWAVDVAQVLEAVQSATKDVTQPPR